MASAWQDQKTEQLFSAILTLKTVSECEQFFRDLCTLSEIRAMSERWQVAQMLDEKVPYRKISKKTGTSTATVTRIAHWLHHGEGGYRLALSRT